MMSLAIVPLQAGHLEDAIALVVRRYQSLRLRRPILPTRYEKADLIAGLLNELGPQPVGVAALQGARLVGFITGFQLQELLGQRSFFSPEWANAAEQADSRRIYEEMYAHISSRWVAEGCFLHAVSILGHDFHGIKAWQWLGFGMAAVDGVREPKAIPGVETDLQIRRAGLEDAPQVGELFSGLERYMAGGPIFWLHEFAPPETWLADPENEIWLAEMAGDVVGCMCLLPDLSGGCDILIDDKTIHIENVFIKENARSKGIGLALLNHCLERARMRGFARCAVDFEAANALAARFWLRHFDPVCYSLIRCIDQRAGKNR